MPCLIIMDINFLPSTKTRMPGIKTAPKASWVRSGTVTVSMQTLMGFIFREQMAFVRLLEWNGKPGRVMTILWRPSAWRSILWSSSQDQQAAEYHQLISMTPTCVHTQPKDRNTPHAQTHTYSDNAEVFAENKRKQLPKDFSNERSLKGK